MAPAADEFTAMQQWVWARLPASKYAAGRRRVLELIPLAIDRWSDDMAQASGPGDPAFAFMTDSLRRDVRRIYDGRRYGAFWIIVVSSLIGELVRLLVLWWLSRSDRKQLFRKWRRKRHA
jgi:hypothetical protein